MTKKEHAKVLAALEAVAPEEPINQDEQGGCVWCGGTPLGSPYGYATSDRTHHEKDCGWVLARDAIAIMRKEPQGWVGVPSKPTTAMLRPFYACPPDELELAWDAMLAITGVQAKTEPISDAELKQMWIDAVCEAHTHDTAEAYEIFAAALLEKAR